ncbi:MAG: quinolinate synthase NadA [Lachnospiraceae bacterium]|nr:quinolinate synthase NadA [Lachnospiraceae bacterium]
MSKNTSIIDKINHLKKENNAIILAHYYVSDDVQEIADYIGDSYYLSKIAADTDADMIVFCGVSFMGESAKLLNKNKTVLMPDETADCPMAHMCDTDTIKKVRAEYDDVAVVCYINSTAELKMHSDVCVTSSNAEKIVRTLPNKNIFFIPDENLARYIAKKIPEKNFIFNNGYCPIHKEISLEELLTAKENHPDAMVLSHPECTAEILKHSDFIGSTSELITFATESECSSFIIATEEGVFYELQKNNPEKKFYKVNNHQTCPGMKLITLEKIANVLENHCNSVQLSAKAMELANKPLTEMLRRSTL